MNAAKVEVKPTANQAQNPQQPQLQNPNPNNKAGNRDQMDSNDPPAGNMMPPMPSMPRKE